MAGRVIWSNGAKADLKGILNYWKNRNGSNVYPDKLRNLLLNATQQILLHPYANTYLTHQNTRKKLVKDYFIVYKLHEHDIVVISIFDTRQDPGRLRNKI